MFSISFLDRLGAGRLVRSCCRRSSGASATRRTRTSPSTSAASRWALAGVLIGFLMLRFGVVPLLVWHFTVDAIYTALLLLRSGNAYYVVSGAIASGILLLPLLLSLVL